MPDNSTDDEKNIIPDADQGPAPRPTASHNTPPNGPSAADDVILSGDDDGNGASRAQPDP